MRFFPDTGQIYRYFPQRPTPTPTPVGYRSGHPSFLQLLTSFLSLDMPFQISPAFLERSVILMPGWSDLIFSRLALSHSM